MIVVSCSFSKSLLFEDHSRVFNVSTVFEKWILKVLAISSLSTSKTYFLITSLGPFGNLDIEILASASASTFKYKRCLLHNINHVLSLSIYFIISNSITCNVSINVSWKYLITKTQYFIIIFSFPKFLDPVRNIVPKVLLTYSLTFIYQVTAIHWVK